MRFKLNALGLPQQQYTNRPVTTELVLTFSPLSHAENKAWRVDQRQRCLCPARKNKINPAKAGRILWCPPGRLYFRGFGDERARLFLDYFLLARQKKVSSCRATPGQR